uniref:Uncharacterized protein n=1 Tax=Timema bartmani TaxID=61472 RepID=A0A7R9F9R6_9NEOP|nr:unnamed protein product [Timema bartmani]
MPQNGINDKILQVWSKLKYKGRSRATLLRAGRLGTGNKPNNEPGLNDNEKVIMIMGIETAEGYCVADSLPEGQEDLERAIEGTTVLSVGDEPPKVFLKEMLEIPTELVLVVEQDPDSPAYSQVETFSHPTYSTLLSRSKQCHLALKKL